MVDGDAGVERTQPARIAISSICRGHLYALARELERRGQLAAVYSGYAKKLLAREEFGAGRVFTYPWVHMPYMAAVRTGWLPAEIEQRVLRVDYTSYERFVARNLVDADIFHGLSCHNLRPGLLAKERGARYVCDRGSSHIEYQDRILREEGERVGIPVRPIDPVVIERERAEYEASDRIFVPSMFAAKTFREKGIDSGKLWSFPYGVNLTRWRRISVSRDKTFRVVYLGSLTLRKGIHDLLAAFRKAALPKAELVLIGTRSAETTRLLERYSGGANLIFTGPLHHDRVLEWFSRSNVFVLPSIEDGFGLVLLEAQACGLPVIATENTGGPDVIVEGQNGYVVPIRSPDVIAERITYLYRERDHASTMGENALASVAKFNGWSEFAERMIRHYERLLNERK